MNSKQTVGMSKISAVKKWEDFLKHMYCTDIHLMYQLHKNHLLQVTWPSETYRNRPPFVRCLSPETSPALKWPVPELWPEECDTSRYTDAPESWSLWSDHSNLRCTWTCDPAEGGHRHTYDERCTDQTEGHQVPHAQVMFPQMRRLPAFYGCGFSPDFGPFLPPQPARVLDVPLPSLRVLFTPQVFTNISDKFGSLNRTGLGWAGSTYLLRPQQSFFTLQTANN